MVLRVEDIIAEDIRPAAKIAVNGPQCVMLLHAKMQLFDMLILEAVLGRQRGWHQY